MFFKKKKYLFPVEKEPGRFNFKIIFTALSVTYLFCVITMFTMLKNSGEQSKKTRDFFFNRSPDLIVVPTGDKGRISLAINMAKKYKLSNIFITGVYKKIHSKIFFPEIFLKI